MRAAARFLDGLSGGLNRIALWGAVLAVLVMAFAAGYQVVARYVFDAPPVWTEELARRAMVWAGMLGATVAFRERTDPTLFPEMLAVAGTMGKVAALVRTAGVAIFALPVLYYSLFGPNMNLARGFIGRSLDRKAEMMGISMAWFTVAVPIAFAIIIIHVLASLVLRLTQDDSDHANLREEHPA
jgi:TRAP-type C4-dicarboxylate transport system permease small subunit